jgi:acyl-CoA dehydrogenase
MIHFAPLAASVYYGIAAGARDEAVRVVRQRRRVDGQPLVHDPTVQRQIGVMDHKLRTAWWTILGSLDEMGEDPTPDEPTANLLQIMKTYVVDAAISVVDQAMEAVGGSAYFKRSSVEMAYRDVRAGKFHPLTNEKALTHSGRLALGLPVDTIW